MSVDPQEEVYIEFLNYDWDSFQEFQEGLSQILENHLESLKERDPSVTSIPPANKQQLIDQAKCFFYCSQSGNILSLMDYYEWKTKYGDKYDKNKKIMEIEPESETFSESNTDEPPYSSNYQEVVELIVSGKPVPGIKQIDDTVLTDQVSQSTALQRRKPWEK